MICFVPESFVNRVYWTNQIIINIYIWDVNIFDRTAGSHNDKICSRTMLGHTHKYITSLDTSHDGFRTACDLFVFYSSDSIASYTVQINSIGGGYSRNVCGDFFLIASYRLLEQRNSSSVVFVCALNKLSLNDIFNAIHTFTISDKHCFNNRKKQKKKTTHFLKLTSKKYS